MAGAVQLLEDLPLGLGLASTKVEWAGRHQAGAGKCLEPKLRKARVHVGQMELIRLVVGPRWGTFEIKVRKIVVRGRH